MERELSIMGVERKERKKENREDRVTDFALPRHYVKSSWLSSVFYGFCSGLK